MVTIISSNFLNRLPIEETIRKFAQQFSADTKIIDIGCGSKPYARYFSGQYIGCDHTPGPQVDLVCDSAAIPLPTASFDVVIATQTLEHTDRLQETVKEIQRLLKPGGYCFVSVPLAMKVHAIPQHSHFAPYHNFNPEKIPYWNVDFWRFTKFGLIILFKHFKIVVVKETSGYIGTLAQLINYFFASFNVPYVFIPLYILTNVIGLAADGIIHLVCKKSRAPLLQKFYWLIYASLPLNYILIARKPLPDSDPAVS
ncbi:MAG: hypothetical protein COT71_02510 [Candidatus Andersenbacteria bacterium CG10_big_fil_rev_8_21_14_0_10_54_11]|uniref:Methyltransferase type 11 domain-containing protein n=1 Tax=Candidatus Andersenbacteria bacterium CG10_big_fil_rev_8_21_14_0_10_54_11 TaxID=1974485 RepID=A0A2M6WZC0_9BACT|nr:MAG: hypothetical protein COT71_02510 [Candidatus Andersenbacteria bacterium CG10_big_fil_rev_8_21_14_0_10_54_11]